MKKESKFTNNMMRGEPDGDPMVQNHHTDYHKKDMVYRDFTDEESNMIEEWTKKNKVKKIGVKKEPSYSSGLKMALW